MLGKLLPFLKSFTHCFDIPMLLANSVWLIPHNLNSSLNLSVAGGVILYEILRQRGE